jgi:hypothetical protein
MINKKEETIMFHDFQVHQWVKIRQREVERKARNAWKFYEAAVENNVQTTKNSPSISAINSCCTPACSCSQA